MGIHPTPQVTPHSHPHDDPSTMFDLPIGLYPSYHQENYIPILLGMYRIDFDIICGAFLGGGDGAWGGSGGPLVSPLTLSFSSLIDQPYVLYINRFTLPLRTFSYHFSADYSATDLTILSTPILSSCHPARSQGSPRSPYLNICIKVDITIDLLSSCGHGMCWWT